MSTNLRAMLAASLLAACSQNDPQTQTGSDKADILDACAPSRLMLILDRSSSMQTGTINGETKWSIATSAIDSISAQFQDSLEMGLMAFPAEGQCSPGTTLVQPGLTRRDDIAEQLAEPPPTGGNWTPMAETLAAAAQEPSLVSADTERYALLITDGWQWCDPYDPGTRFNAVDRVQELKDMGVTTYVVGFGASVDARALNLMAVAAGTERLGCDSSGATPDAANPCYYQADSPLELHDALQEIVVTIAGEECDGEDNDCDGRVDEDLFRDCGTDCGTGQETCTNGQWGGCDAPPVEPDICDGEDNDCDGLTDPGCECLPGDERACGTAPNQGTCSPGVQTCDSNGQWGECEGEVGPSEEVCDGQDNDCDGTPDNVDDLEVCDGVDNDCDGQVDENITRACSTACGLGEETCVNGDFVGCDAPPVEEDVCDGLDNDCDGTADNDCECLPGETIECGESDVGECQKGVQTCDPNGNWGACEGDQGPETEICDELDNDCDGETDESDGFTDPLSVEDDVYAICPTGDDQPEPPQSSDDPPPPAPELPEDEAPAGAVASGCNSSGSQSSGAAALLLLALGVAFRRRETQAPSKARRERR